MSIIYWCAKYLPFLKNSSFDKKDIRVKMYKNMMNYF